MLVLTSKKYEIEETIKAINEENETFMNFKCK